MQSALWAKRKSRTPLSSQGQCFIQNITPEATNLATVAIVRFLVAGIGLLEGLEEHVEQNRGRDAEPQQDVARQVQGRVVGG